MTRSLPEKTFEHWCSIHLNYRYRSHLQMWWPSNGADIDVIATPHNYGKRVWLELKTVEWKPVSARHDLSIDLKQLDAYGKGAVPDYYVFPTPGWHGVLGADAASGRWLDGLSPSLLAYQTRSKEKWFANWTFVVPGHVLRRSLAPEITAALARGTSMACRIAEIENGRLKWIPRGLTEITPIPWKRFWEIMETCGSPDYPAQFIVPRGLERTAADGPTLPRSQLVASLRAILSNSPLSNGAALDGFQLYSQIVHDDYQAAAADGSGLSDGFVWEGAGRALVLLEAGGLRI